MSLMRKIVLSIYLVVVVILAIALSDDLLWLKIVLLIPFLVGLFWPGRAKSDSARSDVT